MSADDRPSEDQIEAARWAAENAPEPLADIAYRMLLNAQEDDELDVEVTRS